MYLFIMLPGRMNLFQSSLALYVHFFLHGSYFLGYMVLPVPQILSVE